LKALIAIVGVTVIESTLYVEDDSSGVDESKLKKTGATEPEVDGFVLATTYATTESFGPTKPAIVKVAAVDESDLAAVEVPLTTVTVRPETAACEGTELSTPRPNAATATSAMRLKFVVVDICFLSIVVSKYFLEAALR
jgi:hypothetical protein